MSPFTTPKVMLAGAAAIAVALALVLMQLRLSAARLEAANLRERLLISEQNREKLAESLAAQTAAVQRWKSQADALARRAHAAISKAEEYRALAEKRKPALRLTTLPGRASAMQCVKLLMSLGVCANLAACGSVPRAPVVVEVSIPGHAP